MTNDTPKERPSTRPPFAATTLYPHNPPMGNRASADGDAESDEAVLAHSAVPAPTREELALVARKFSHRDVTALRRRFPRPPTWTLPPHGFGQAKNGHSFFFLFASRRLPFP